LVGFRWNWKNPIQSNNPTKNPKIQLSWILTLNVDWKSNIIGFLTLYVCWKLFWIFGVGFGWMFNHPSNPKPRKKLTS
jgi:hypothetical protein